MLSSISSVLLTIIVHFFYTGRALLHFLYLFVANLDCLLHGYEGKDDTIAPQVLQEEFKGNICAVNSNV